MSAHTPGPWGYDHATGAFEEDVFIITGPGGAPLLAYVEADEENGLTGGAVEANARLIAAVPDLLAACKTLWAYAYSTHNPGTLPQQVRDAERVIAKAEGREPPFEPRRYFGKTRPSVVEAATRSIDQRMEAVQ